MNNIFLILSNIVETSKPVESTLNGDALAAQAMLETPPLQLIGIGFLSVAVFMAFFVLVFYIVSSILNFASKLNDRYYEKTGKKRPINRRKRNGKNF